MNKMYIIQKIVLAPSIERAIAIEGDYPVSEVFLEGEWRKNNLPELASERTIGFTEKQ